MKANELMVGDWVYTKDYPMIKSPQRIRPEHFVRSLVDFEPILLTKEILEKNGFHKEWDEDIMLMVCDTIIVEIGDNYKLYKDGKMYLRRVLSPLYYVHQLQHALRLCGISKEIEL